MKHFTGKGYIADGSGQSDNPPMELGMTMQVRGQSIEGFAIRIGEAGKKMEDSREACIVLSKEGFSELIAAMQKELILAEEAAAI